MTSFDSFNRFFREVDFMLEQLTHFDVGLAQVCRTLPLVTTMAYLRHEQVGAVVTCQVLPIEKGRVATAMVCSRGSAPLKCWNGQLLREEGSIVVFMNAIKSAFRRLLQVHILLLNGRVDVKHLLWLLF